jgi:hypothetical protein
MMIRQLIVSLGVAGLMAAPAFADDEVEVMARGPVHEAYAEPSEREPKPTPIVRKEPPKPIEELPPDQKPEGDNVQWLPGYWAWDEDKSDYLWVSGFWRVAPPGRTWVPGSWRQAGDGWQWTGGFWAQANAGKADVEYLPQPPAPLDTDGPTTPAPSENHTYVTGSWVYRDRYVWRPGYWIEHRPNWVWTSAHYRWTPAGYVFIDGYWDYPLASRGVLFAPAYIPPTVYTVPNYVYTPTVVVREECLYGAFFARRGFGCYYFGDYFAPRYAGLGFTAWSGHVSATVSIGGGWCDPLFSYYRCGYRHDPFWRGGCADLYVGRYRGTYARPPINLVQQNTVINNITNNTTVVKNTNVTVNNVQMLTSIRNQDRVGNMNLRRVSDSVVRSDAAAARDLRATATRRGEQETRLTAATRPGGRPAGPQRATLEVPQRPTAAARPAVERPGSGAAIARPTPPSPRPTPAGISDSRPSPAPRPKPAVAGTNPRPDAPAVAGTSSRPNVPTNRVAPKVDNRPDPVAPRPTGPALARPDPKPAGVNPDPKPAPRPAPAPRAEPKPVPSAVTPRPAVPAPRPAPARPESRPAPAKKEPAKQTSSQSARSVPYSAAKPDVVRGVAPTTQAPARTAPRPQAAPERIAPKPQSVAPRASTQPAVRSAPRVSAPAPKVSSRPQPAARPAPKAAPKVQRSAPRPQPAVKAAPKPGPKVSRPAPKPQVRSAPKVSAPKAKPAVSSPAEKKKK